MTFRPSVLPDRILSKIDVDHTTGCWIWVGRVDGYGYGMLRIGGRRGRCVGAHRASYATFVGPIPKGHCVMHECDEPRCVNPEHLSAGTRAANNRDRDRKGRQRTPRGMAHPNAKLTPEKVRAIRASTESGTSLARKYRVSRKLISNVRLRKTWRHV